MSPEAGATRILIVDADEDEATLVEAYLRDGLKEPGLVVRHAAAPAAARAELEAGPFDVILIDLRPGNEEALPFLASLRERSPVIPSVVLTGRTNADAAVQALRAGAAEVLVKPAQTPASLAATVRHAMQLEESRRKETATEMALRRAERQAEALVAASLDIMSIVDAGGTIRFASPSVERLLGYPPEKIVGGNVFEMIRSADRARVVEAFRRGLEDPATPIAVEYAVRHADGSVRRLESLGTNLLDDPAVAGVVVTSRDVTERHRAEDELRRLEAAVEQSVSIIFLTDSDGVISYVNPAFTRAYGYTRDEAVGATPRLIKSGRHSAEFYRELWGTLLGGGNFRSELVNRARDGRLVIVRTSVGPIRDRNGNVAGFLAVQDDVTDRSVMAERLRVAQKMEAVGHLAREVAIELEAVFSNVLEGIDAAAARLPAGDPARGLLAAAHAEARRGAALGRELVASVRGPVTGAETVDGEGSEDSRTPGPPAPGTDEEEP